MWGSFRFFYFLLCNVSINAHVEQYWCYGSPKHPKGVSDLVGYIERYSRLSIKKDKLYIANYQIIQANNANSQGKKSH